MSDVEIGWLCLGGIELIHDARVLSYLNRGLAGPAMAMSIGVETTGTVVGVIESPYSDTYSDAYGEPVTINCADGFNPVCLDCACPALMFGEEFIDPTTDDAPWYQASAPRSAEFLGALSTSIRLPSPISREVQPRSRVGGVPGPQQLMPRLMQVQAQLYASTPAGIEWGRRWFTDVLAGACEDGMDATYLPYCPASEDDLDATYRVLADTVLVDGPVWGEIGNFGDFKVITVSFQLASPSPWLLGVPAVCESGTLAVHGTHSCLIETPDWGGSQALRLVIGGRTDGVNIQAVPLTSDQDCPVAGHGMPCSTFTLSGAQRGDEYVIDSGRRSALVTDITSKLEVSAIPYIEFAGPFPWIDVPPCSRLCVTITNNGLGTATYSIETVLREL